MREETLEFQKLREAVISAQIQTGAKLAAEWVYEDEDGLEAFRVLELESEDDHRRHVRMVWPELDGPRWFMGEPKRPWPLYGLMELPVGQRVYICQSESAVAEARRAGLAAVSVAHGPNGVDKTSFSPLSGRDVAILPDNDDAGRVLVRKVYRALCRQVPPAEVRVVELPGLSLHGGLFEFGLLRGGTPAELGEAIEEMAEQTAEFEAVRRLPAPRRSTKELPALRTAQLADLRPEQVRWLWPGRIPMGKLSLLFGGPGRGKSFIAAYLAAAVSTGAAWPDDQGAAPCGSVLLLCGQDALGDTVRPRLELAGADLSRVTAMDVAGPARGGAGRVSLGSALERVIEAAARAGRAGGAARLAIIDPVSGLLTGDVCAALDELARVAERYDLAIVMVAGLGREHAGLARPAALGGHALMSAARASWLAVPDVRDPERRLLLPAKNILAGQARGLAYRIVNGAVAWEPGAVDVPDDGVLLSGRRRHKPGPPADKQAEAARWLLGRLSAGPAYVGDGSDTVQSGTLRGELKGAGFSYATLRQAFGAVHAVSERCASTGRYRWRLASAKQGAEDRVGPGQGGTGG
jgi:putative DNA primase/helicase